MIAAWMLFTLEISTLFFVAAWLAERALNAARRPARWVWMTAMIATALLPLTALFAPVPQLAIPVLRERANSIADSATPVMPGWSPNQMKSAANVQPEVHAANAVSSPSTKSIDSPSSGAASDIVSTPQSSIEPSNETIEFSSTGVKSNAERSAGIPVLPSAVASQLEVAPNSAFQRLNSSLLNAWMTVAGISTLICLFAVARTMRQRGTWSDEYVDGTPVLVTHDVGPALIGVLQYSIVVPRWVFELEGRARKLILAHEREHARSYDPILLALGVLVVVVAPWNVVNWFMLRRLRLAIEMDCDQRVLRVHPDARSYSALLLDVAERTLPSVMPQAALVEHGTSLETRIRAMISPSVQHRALRVGGNLLAMGALVAVACVTPRPYASLPSAERVARLKSDLADAEKNLPKDSGAASSEHSVVIDGKTYYENKSVSRADSLKLRGMEAQMTADFVKTRPKTNSIGDTSNSKISEYNAVRQMVAQKKADSLRKDSTMWAMTRAADADEKAEKRVRAAVMFSAPRTLSNWPRKDSVLFVIFNSGDKVVRSFTESRKQFDGEPKTSSAYLMLVFFPGQFNSFSESGMQLLTRESDPFAKEIALRVIWAKLNERASIPRPRSEIIPSHAQMVAELHRSQPQIFDDKSSNPLIGTLLFDTNGKLLATAAVRSTQPRQWPDGQANREYDRDIFRKGFGDLMKEGPIMQNGSTSYFDQSTPHDRAPRVMYAFIYRNSERNIGSGWPVKSGKLNVNINSAMRYRSPEGVMDQKEVDARLMNAVASHVPQAFGKWARTDSAVYMAFNHNDELFSSGAGPIAQNGELDFLIGC